MEKSNQLTLEQEFRLAQYRKAVVKLDDKQTKKYLYFVLKRMMIKDNIIKYIIQNSNL
uniref:Uncharacterized protein ycf18 n=1 Tax=Neogoniolithon spectabile TaxID=231755 RepID=A0A3G3MH02_9FLOR|nr:phycobilisome degradation protein [Neogoniolithon spectabile]AYR06110.1 phycobilisome degradation protein [Neogoniolithon spectabile]